ncbi:MAG: hypothetical protein AB1554_12770 [Chloroflexota bacterium]
MQIYDLCLVWNWEHDADFVNAVNEACAARGLTLLSVSSHNLTESLSRLAGRKIGFRVYLDRASEADPAYLPLAQWAVTLGARRINPRETANRAYDKAAMHLAFLGEGIPTPYTILFPSCKDDPAPQPIDLTPLGKRFAVKPAFGGGGEGVVTEVCSFEQFLVERRSFPEQKYLLQAYVTPRKTDGLPAWFRVICCFGEIHPSFWNTRTHVYTPLTAEAESRLGLGGLREVTERIARVCRLDLFSTEIALTEEDRLLVVDYVNDPIDLRLQSRAADGVPDFIVRQISARIADEAKKNSDGI